MKKNLLLFCIWMLPTWCIAQQGSSTGEDINKLRDQIAAQQKLLEQQRLALETQQKALDDMRRQLERLSGKPIPEAKAPVPAEAPVAKAMPPAVPLDTKGKPFSPLAFHIGGADFAPGGFLDIPIVWRSRNVGNGIATSFGGIPFKNTAAGRLAETRLSAQNSRLTLKVTASPTKTLNVTNWVEVDFWGSQPTTAYITSNSQTLRLRQFWVNLQRGKWEFLAGQAWTLLTPNRVGTSSMPSDLFIGIAQDSNYLAGLVWTRSGQFRATYHPTPKWAIAAAVENPEQFVGAGTAVPAYVSSQVSTGGSTLTPNLAPDLTAKAAFDTKVNGRAFHLEWGGLWRQFRVSPAVGKSSHGQGFGGSFNVSLELAKGFRVIGNSYYSSGGGRYILGLGPDFIVGPDDHISPVHAMSGVLGIEYQADPLTTLFAYHNGAYFRRNFVEISPGSFLGFGYPTSPTTSNRQLQESSLGLVRTFFRDPNYGAFQLTAQYSYVIRHVWATQAPSAGDASVHMVFTGLRYLIP